VSNSLEHVGVACGSRLKGGRMPCKTTNVEPFEANQHVSSPTVIVDAARAGRAARLGSSAWLLQEPLARMRLEGVLAAHVGDQRVDIAVAGDGADGERVGAALHRLGTARLSAIVSLPARPFWATSAIVSITRVQCGG